jgi:hypothetical protein
MKAIRPAANLGPANLFAVLTIIAFLTALPIALVMEGAKAQPAWDKAIAGGQTPMALAQLIAISGLSFYMYNEVSFLALDAVDPVTHAVGNTIKVSCTPELRAGAHEQRLRRFARARLPTRLSSAAPMCAHKLCPPPVRPLARPLARRAACDPDPAQRRRLRHQDDHSQRGGLDYRDHWGLHVLDRKGKDPGQEAREGRLRVREHSCAAFYNLFLIPHTHTGHGSGRGSLKATWHAPPGHPQLQAAQGRDQSSHIHHHK